jgi:hypothetical protein
MGDPSEEMIALCAPYGGILERVVDLMATGSGTDFTFGAALEQAKRELGFETIPDNIEEAILRAAFRITCSGLPTNVES